MTTTFATKLEDAKARLGLTDEELAAQIRRHLARHGLGRTARKQISRWRNGQHAPAIPTRAVIVAWLAEKISSQGA